ncbi:lipopolysaccharide core heptose(I) kinase RfaP [Biformimicrobium ophioploci]|uniref:Lipopolysaccharide core heptose(I) kinase n=1 Tax=Biformimicrobium ophioploci TaxID=3036711 RepID=A0ABQ6M0J1_9GAMM|nr:lipopolysaccharide core heptose(I) kinase RfaP [Microbulbifer sp. NKW57]GMG87879.1 lipopolysaccharide core heptose(I) kinase RfaP [Microbulbifer sp. NKW57]
MFDSMLDEPFLAESFRVMWEGQDPFERLWQMPGTEYRRMPGRRTFRFEIDGCAYFAKLHAGEGWGPVLGDLLRLRKPVLGAATEYRALRMLEVLGIDTMRPVAFAERGLSPSARESFLVTEALEPTVSLETFCADWKALPPPLSIKRKLIRRVAEIARDLHEGGVNHRDFYLCHFLLRPETLEQESLVIHLIDLHRAQIRHRVPERWRIKDLSGLWFSACDIGLTRADLMRFVEIYSGRRPSVELRANAARWKKVWVKMARVRAREKRKIAAGIPR